MLKLPQRAESAQVAVVLESLVVLALMAWVIHRSPRWPVDVDASTALRGGVSCSVVERSLSGSNNSGVTEHTRWSFAQSTHGLVARGMHVKASVQGGNVKPSGGPHFASDRAREASTRAREASSGSAPSRSACMANPNNAAKHPAWASPSTSSSTRLRKWVRLHVGRPAKGVLTHG